MFPILLAVDGSSYMDLHDESDSYVVMYYHILHRGFLISWQLLMQAGSVSSGLYTSTSLLPNKALHRMAIPLRSIAPERPK